MSNIAMLYCPSKSGKLQFSENVCPLSLTSKELIIIK